MRNLAKRAEFRICFLGEMTKISVFSDFFVEKILVKLNYDVYLYSINGYKSVNL